jgi:hypothetical protein
MDIGAIKARIAELEQRKAERNAMRGYRDLSYLDYIAQGDRSGFDKIDAEEAAYRNMLKQQEFNARENELNRQNALTLASMNKDSQSAYDKQRLMNSKELELDLLKAKREEVARVGGNTKEYDLKINSIYKQFPELGTAVEVETPWDPTKSQSYLLASYSDYDDSYSQDELNKAITDFGAYATTDEGAKRLAELNKALKKRIKLDQNAAQIQADLNAYIAKGTVTPLLYEVGYEEGGPSGARYIQRNGKGAKLYRKYSGNKGNKGGLPSPKSSK